jgi:hypothetical protein
VGRRKLCRRTSGSLTVCTATPTSSLISNNIHIISRGDSNLSNNLHSPNIAVLYTIIPLCILIQSENSCDVEFLQPNLDSSSKHTAKVLFKPPSSSLLTLCYAAFKKSSRNAPHIMKSDTELNILRRAMLMLSFDL